jgi:ubiquinol-cytochrome c reductase cytochrome c1 subunit
MTEMMRKLAITAISALVLGAGAAQAEGAAHIEDFAFSFEGPFGKFEEHQLQRGLQVFTEVCAACHGLKYLRIGALAEDGGPHLPEDQVRAYAAALTVADDSTGEDRPATPADRFPPNTGAGAPDLSLMAKARAAFHGPYGLGINQLFRGMGGPEYIRALLTSYSEETKEEAGATFYANHAFSTGWISMPPPLSEGLVTYQDGTEATVEQMAEDVSAFLMWVAEPKMMERKRAGLLAVLFLGLIATLLYLTNKRLWAPHKGKTAA